MRSISGKDDKMDNVIIMDKLDNLENRINTIQETVTLHTENITTLLENNTNLTNSVSNLILNQHWYITVEPSDNLITQLYSRRSECQIFIPVPGNYKIKTRGGGLYSTASSNVIVTSNTTQNNVHLGIGTYSTSGGSDYTSTVSFYGDLVIKNFDNNTKLSKFFQ